MVAYSLHPDGDLAQLLDLVLVDLVESDQDAGATVDEQIGQKLDLIAQAGLDDVASMASQATDPTLSGAVTPLMRRRTASGSKSRSRRGRYC